MASNGYTTSPHVDISLPVNRPTQPGEWTPQLDARLRAKETSNVQLKSPNTIQPDLYPQCKRSLSGIAVRAFCLGLAGAVGFMLTAQLAYHGSNLWRPFLFLGTLSVFHFLEFYTTAAYNTPGAYVSSFLLTNGDQYRQAHTMAFVETLVTSYFFPGWQARVHTGYAIAAGVAMVVVGQTVRSVAMAQAGTNFNHMVQSRKTEGHELVTTGLYAFFRHPSYFGFFWWGIGTQVLLGNTVCTLGYAGVLWYFFMKRITREFAPPFFVFVEAPLLTTEQTRKSTSSPSSATTTRPTAHAHVYGSLLSKPHVSAYTSTLRADMGVCVGRGRPTSGSQVSYE
jgi:protein-S-isoprenylcysteine O-methyltransferase